jgi:hypothetical protein
VDPTVAIAAIVQRDFQRVVVLKGKAEVSPAPDTLVNIPTRFTTDAPASYDIPLTLLGQSVTITATARRWTWHFGDGESAAPPQPAPMVGSSTRTGRPRRPARTWRSSGRGPTASAAAPSCPSPAPRRRSGDPTPLEVKQARTELVHDST